MFDVGHKILVAVTVKITHYLLGRETFSGKHLHTFWFNLFPPTSLYAAQEDRTDGGMQGLAPSVNQWKWSTPSRQIQSHKFPLVWS
jgi:hypothetical protein